MAIESEIREIVRELPGITAKNIAELMPHVNNPSARIAMLLKRGEIRSEKVDNPNFGKSKTAKPKVNGYWIGDGKPPVPKARIAKTPTVDITIAERREVTAELAELRAWKAAAIARYPDLAVSNEVWQARQVVAKYFRDNDDRGKAEAVLRGHHDNSPAVQIAIRAAESAT